MKTLYVNPRNGPKVSEEERFTAKYIITRNGCWLWVGGGAKRFEPRFWVSPVMVPAIRWSYAHYIGDIPIGENIYQTCDNKLCVNPDHLCSMKPIYPMLTDEEIRNRKLEAI